MKRPDTFAYKCAKCGRTEWEYPYYRESPVECICGSPMTFLGVHIHEKTVDGADVGMVVPLSMIANWKEEEK